MLGSVYVVVSPGTAAISRSSRKILYPRILVSPVGAVHDSVTANGATVTVATSPIGAPMVGEGDSLGAAFFPSPPAARAPPTIAPAKSKTATAIARSFFPDRRGGDGGPPPTSGTGAGGNGGSTVMTGSVGTGPVGAG